MDRKPDDEVHPKDRRAWRAWLAKHHARTDGVWLLSWKKASGKPSMGYDAAVEEALCFGWVDSRPRAVDAERTALWFAPRKPGSGWSRPNKERVAQLEAEGKMAPAGQAKVDAARADGSWTALDEVEAGVVPDDLAAALRAHPDAEAHFAAFPRSAKRGILEWIAQAKTPATRAKRVLDTATKAQRNERANQWTPK
ncbi:MAG: YdeI/OmpD-associated family protein [Silanimonas sp.]